MRRTRVGSVVVAGMALLVASACTVRLGTVGGFESTANDINLGNTIVGASTAADGHWHPFVRPYGGPMVDLGLTTSVLPPTFPPDVPPPDRGFATAVNDDGVVVGWMGNFGPGGFGYSVAFAWTQADGFVGIPGLSLANDVNASGTIVGEDSAQHASVFEPGAPSAIELPLLPGVVSASSTTAAAIDGAGDIVGCAPDATGISRAVWWSGASHTPTALSTELTGGACLNGVNDGGFAVGWWFRDSVRVAAMWNLSTGERTDIADNADAAQINDAGVVVGFRLGAGFVRHAYKWTAAAGFTVLGTSPGSPAGTGNTASAINDNGAPVGTETTPDSHQHAVSY